MHLFLAVGAVPALLECTTCFSLSIPIFPQTRYAVLFRSLERISRSFHKNYCAITPSTTAPDPISCTCSLFTFLIIPCERHAYPQSLITPLCTLLLHTISAIGKTGSMCPALRQHESVKHANFSNFSYTDAETPHRLHSPRKFHA